LAAGSAVGAVGLLAFGCTFLVDFKEKPDTVTDFDADQEDGSLGDTGASGDDAGADDSGGGDTGANPCVGRSNGFQWDQADEYARCCNGIKVRTTVDEFCGTCEIACNKAKGQTCEAFRGRYYCRGCDASAECWSGCCSKQFGGGSCAASNCTTGDCNASLCKGGTVCVVPGDASNYCKY
jgi:hypothetical protein